MVFVDSIDFGLVSVGAFDREAIVFSAWVDLCRHICCKVARAWFAPIVLGWFESETFINREAIGFSVGFGSRPRGFAPLA